MKVSLSVWHAGKINAKRVTRYAVVSKIQAAFETFCQSFLQAAQLCSSTVAPLGGDVTPCTEARIALIEKMKKQMGAVFAVQKAAISCYNMLQDTN